MANVLSLMTTCLIKIYLMKTLMIVELIHIGTDSIDIMNKEWLFQIHMDVKGEV